MRPLGHAALAALAALVALTAACGGRAVRTPPLAIDPPAFRPEALLPTGADAYGVALALSGRIENPNPMALPVAGFTYAFEVMGAPAGGGQVASELVLPAGGAVPVTVPVRLRWADVPGFLEALATRPSLPVTVSGAARVRAGGGTVAVPYRMDGSVVLPRLPSVTLADAVVRESTLFHTVVELRVSVRNPNPFPLPTGRLSYDLSVSGVPVIQAAKSALDAVPPQGQATVVVPVRFSTVGAAAGALAGAVRGRADLSVSGRAGYGALEVGVDLRGALAAR
ncbi:LEA type 2 family protein [Anaeromyxobacter sp. PSR-1]|uniref:LEA type 2 family protein n=1 Tax=unclassified Anaeromyxobacter TaxID=2620896 RepID=UPI0005E5A59B|nr:LEA type 2 family protein [Anaeromyxobacter sp. PSR-1]GAO03917.1 late embryogenesis abundant protein [Anaeromyxobacter sp. PSR-1]